MANYVKMQYEATPVAQGGTPTLSTKQVFLPITDGGVTLNPDHLERDDEVRGTNEPVAVFSEAFAPSWEIGGMRGYPDALGFVLKGALGSPVSTPGNGIITDLGSGVVPTGVTRHRWTAPFGPSGISPQTVQQIWSFADTSGNVYRAHGCATESIELATPDRGGMSVRTGGPVLHLERITDPVLSPTYESLAIKPFLRSGLTLPSWLASSSVIDNATDLTVSISNPVATHHTLGSGSKFPSLAEKGDGPVVVSGSIPVRRLGSVDWDAARDATGFPALMRWESETIAAGGYTYKLFMKLDNAQYVSMDQDSLTTDRHHGGSFGFKATSGTSGNPSVTIELLNLTPSYS